jgi:hypothetical protein
MRAAIGIVAGLLLLPIGADPVAVHATAPAAQTRAAGDVALDGAVEPARQAIARVIGATRAAQVGLNLVPTHAGRDWFRISNRQQRVQVDASTTPALLMGFNWYLKHVARADVSMNGNQLALPDPLPLPPAPIQRSANVTHRFALNDTNEGYTGPYQTWEEWERHIDVLALHGANEALVYVGHEAVYYRALQQFGYTAEEVRRWIPQPGHQPWWLLQNMCCYPSPVSAQLIDQRVQLGRRIADRMRELGITPVFPGYYGTVPTDFEVKNPGARTVPQGGWAAFTRSDWLDPTGDHFRRLAAAFYQIQTDLFGVSSMYKMDLLHEGGTAGPVPIADASRAVQNALAQAHPQALWAILGWEGNPRAETLAAVDRSRMLVLDGISEFSSVTNREADFAGAPYAFGTIWNFGGHTSLSAPLTIWNQKFHAWRTKAGSALNGIALMPEAIDNNPAAVEFFMELPWHPGPVDINQWFADYAHARYGIPDTHARQAWQILATTAYNAPGDWSPKETTGLFGMRPGLGVRAADLNYSTATFDRVLDELLQVAPAGRAGGAYRFDLVDVARQVLGNRSRDLLPQIAAAYQAGDLEALRRLNTVWLQLLDLLDEVLATEPNSLLGTWLADAKRWAANDTESAHLEYDARKLITTWGDRATEVHIGDYARREWAGLVGDYYKPRWQTFLSSLETALQTGRQPAAIDWYAVGDDWSKKRNVFTTTPVGDTYLVADRIRQRLRTEPSLAALTVTADPVALPPGQSTTVTTRLRNTNGFEPARNVTLGLSVPAGLTVQALDPVTTTQVASGNEFAVRWRVTAQTPGRLVSLVRATAQLTYAGVTGTALGGIPTLTGQPVQSPNLTVTSNGARFAQQGAEFGIHGGGADMWQGIEEYGAIYRAGAVRHENLISTKVTRQDPTGPWARAGILVRNTLTGADRLGSVNLAVTPANGCVLTEDTNGDGLFDATHTAAGFTAPVWLRLHRGPAGFTGECSKDGLSWTRVGVVAAPGTAVAQDAGLFMTAANGGSAGRGLATFDGFRIEPLAALR